MVCVSEYISIIVIIIRRLELGLTNCSLVVISFLPRTYYDESTPVRTAGRSGQETLSQPNIFSIIYTF